MIHQVKLSELQGAAALIRANPQMDRETFYQTMTAANPAGLTQEQIETAIQMVTGTLVDLGFVETNHFDEIAPWVRSLPSPQVPMILKAIHDKYLENIKPLIIQDKIGIIDAALVVIEEKILTATTYHASIVAAQPGVAEVLSAGISKFQSAVSAFNMEKQKLISELGGD